ncbi:prolyl-tRNA editing enzyme YbaK/EbsC (Cys-tRNA(Pro) deacylase) [Inhella inkyongensis]|uniref:Prolyl-tRNA editing enzyme YbaK/EbsC (Cys-tRNA(Pro) deacylase) n=1 Tax=Inhella inkyongensis TaxID=392593 RepID=A0A840S991_9BURK|nr:YbaK/EbsC family protein [Inhella inkyongensis]MBB5206098.1 prolyl-tRNA editing enzyme YbaK/EbsC (Cys-tRNA(Pro) deacylase) [Inhella inkyongensis]
MSQTHDDSHPGVARVRGALRAAGCQAEPRWLDEATHTAAQAAEALGVPLGAIAKSVLLRFGEQAVLCITAGDRRVNAASLSAEFGQKFGPHQKADADFVRRHTGFAIGGVAPLGFEPSPGSAAPQVLMDPSLMRFETVWAAAGHPRTVFGLPPQQLLQHSQARLTPFADET